MPAPIHSPGQYVSPVRALWGLHPKPIQMECIFKATYLFICMASLSPTQGLTEPTMARTGLSPSLPNSPSAPTGSGQMP